MAIASLVLGIASVIVAFFVHGFNWLAILIGLVGIICSVKGRQDASQRTVATIGMILSIIGMVAGLIVYIVIVLIIGKATDIVGDAINSVSGYFS